MPPEIRPRNLGRVNIHRDVSMLWPMADLSRERRRGRLYGIHDSSYRPFEFARRIARIGRGSICFLALLDAGKSENADEKFTGFEDNLLPIYRAIVSLPLSLSLSLSRKRCPLRFANTYSSRCDVIHRERERERERGGTFSSVKLPCVSRDSNEEFARLDGALFIIVLNRHRRRAKKSSERREKSSRKIQSGNSSSLPLGSVEPSPIRDDCPFIPNENCLIQTVTRHSTPDRIHFGARKSRTSIDHAKERARTKIKLPLSFQHGRTGRERRWPPPALFSLFDSLSTTLSSTD